MLPLTLCSTLVPKDMQTFTPVESTEPLKDPAPVKEAEKPEGLKGMRQAADLCQNCI